MLLRRVRTGGERAFQSDVFLSFWWSGVVKFSGFVLQNMVCLPLPSSEKEGSKVGFLLQLSVLCVSFLVHF